MKILITGAGGFLGTRIVHSLLAAGQKDVRCQIREGRGVDKLQALARTAGVETLEVVACNLHSLVDTARLVDGAEVIIHAAAGTRGTPADMMLNTVVATRNLLDAAVAAGMKRMTVVSSFSVYNTEVLADGAWLDEASPVEAVGIDKGPYAFSKVRQEQLVNEYQQRHGFQVVFVRPGVIYGEGGPAMSPRVGIRALGWFASLGGSCLLPLTHVDNCADAVVAASLRGAPGSIFNVVDDGLPTCSQYLNMYRQQVEKLRVLRLPYFMLMLGVRVLVWYSRRSKGQLPAILTPYIVRSTYRPLRYRNAALKSIGWHPAISIAQGLAQTLPTLRKPA